MDDELHECCKCHISLYLGDGLEWGDGPDFCPACLRESHDALLAACQVAEIEMDRMQWGKCDFQTLGERLKLVRAAIARATGQD
jgi:hypothetical protein